MTYISKIPRFGTPEDTRSIPILRRQQSPRAISTSEIQAVFDNRNGDIRGTVEHILAGLDYYGHPGSKLNSERVAPKNYIDTPKAALETLEILLNQEEDIGFNRSNPSQAKKIALGIMILLSEHYKNENLYSSATSRTPDKQKELYQAQQRLTDVFHFLVGNIIDRDFQVSAQLGDIALTDITQDSDTIEAIANSQDFPYIKKTLSLFQGIDDNPQYPDQKQKEAA